MWTRTYRDIWTARGGAILRQVLLNIEYILGDALASFFEILQKKSRKLVKSQHDIFYQTHGYHYLVLPN